jgi:cell division protease FtsH
MARSQVGGQALNKPAPKPWSRRVPPGPRRVPPLAIWAALVLVAIGVWTWRADPGAKEPPTEVDYSTAYQWIAGGKVESVVLDGSSMSGELSEPQTADKQTADKKAVERFVTTVPQADESLIPLLRQKGVAMRVEAQEESTAMRIIVAVLPWVLIIGLWVWISRRARNAMTGGGSPFGGFLRKGRRYEKTSAVEVRFDDVAGLASAKRDLQEMVHFLVEPERFRALGGRIPRGVLLVGPPGSGKTLLARAVAGEADAPFFSISGSEFIEMFVGVGAARVRELFEEAKKHAPSIVFIDEIDAVGRVRGTGLGGGNDEREQTLNQLLSEMDGFERGDLTVVMAATNRPDVLDSALMRPGRFDRRVIVDLPERAARADILRVHSKDKPLADDVDLAAVADGTPGFSGADLANLVNEAALQATRRRAERIERRDFAAALDKIVLGDPRESALVPQEKRRVAVHEAGHAVVAWASPAAEPLRRVSILPRGMALGATQQVPSEDRHLMTRVELDSRLAVLLAGYAAELLVLGEVSTGSEKDLQQATALASRMVAHFGMSEELGPVYYEHREEHAFLGHALATEGGTSDRTVHAIETEARAILARARAAAGAALSAYRAELDRLSAALLEAETLEKEEIERLLGSRPEAPPGPAPALARGSARS